ncbi:protein of unknown function [Mariniphaga anaerophila]|uniref:2-oxoadipate dioxygenase/decarboxylase n=1 Tax=Mariniphaga anaerophila TaxID=1484053 RepID=A0A1M5FWH9_9BACT|nr:DUF1338 family protein [Mariniphaga anaerophila]SHF95813.1 protein of unknown function [Mariniphaga anaerophila]
MKRDALQIAESLVAKLWEAFLIRVPYAKAYNDLVTKNGGQVVLDHLGFRTLNTHIGEQPAGILGIRHIVECLGYRLVEKHVLPKKGLKAAYFETESAGVPKFFVSQLDVAQLPEWVQNLLPDVVADTPYLLSDSGIELLGKLKADGVLNEEAAEILEEELVNYFSRAWGPPSRQTVLHVNDVSHYAAWVLLFGNSPSHFAASVNNQGIAEWPDIESTCRALKANGILMKDGIEGEKGSVLQQAATFAAKEDVIVKVGEENEEMKWAYAYLELIQRGFVNEDGQKKLFGGFVDIQERHLYHLTRTLEN